ncbi:MAG: hypothetical protein V4692_06345 [Bdellovibrionota bacterium]
MKTWFKYAVGFFSFVVLLTVFILVFGPDHGSELRTADQPYQTQQQQQTQLDHPGQPATSK